MQGDLFGGQPTTVVNVNHARCDVYCGRAMLAKGFPVASEWANPYRIKLEAERSMAITNYRAGLMRNPVLLCRVPELRGKVLGCWCAPKPCHCNVLADLADGPALRLLEAHFAARQSFGANTDPRPPKDRWLEFCQLHQLLPAGLKRWAEIQEAEAAAALAMLADMHRAIAKGTGRE